MDINPQILEYLGIKKRQDPRRSLAYDAAGPLMGKANAAELAAQENPLISSSSPAPVPPRPEQVQAGLGDPKEMLALGMKGRYDPRPAMTEKAGTALAGLLPNKAGGPMAPPPRQFHESGDYMGGSPDMRPPAPPPGPSEADRAAAGAYRKDVLDAALNAPAPIPAQNPELAQQQSILDKMKELEDRKNAADRRLGIGRGLDKLGRGLAGLSGVDMNKLPGADLSQLEQNQAAVHNEVRPDEAAYMEKYFGKLPPGMSMDRLKTLLPLAGKQISDAAEMRKAEAAATRADLRAGEKQTSINDRQFQAAVAAERGDRLKPTSRIGKLKDAVIATNQVDELLKQNNPTATRAAMVQVAKKLAGDTGVLTQQDIEAYEGNIGIPGFFTSAEMKIRGDFTPEQKKRLAATAKALGDMAKQNYAAEEKGRNASFEATWAPHIKERGIEAGSLPGMLGAQAPAQGGPSVGSQVKGTDGKLHTVKSVLPNGDIEVE